MHITISRKHLYVVLGALLIASLATPSAVLASHTFSDVPGSSFFHEDITWLAEAGVTTGCSETEYCPKDVVTREQMAAFMHRLADNQVVDAASVEGLAASDIYRMAYAEYADLPDGTGLNKLAVSIEAPVDGWVKVEAWIEAEINDISEDDHAFCYYGSQFDFFMRIPYNYVNDATETDFEGHTLVNQDCHLQWVTPVNAGTYEAYVHVGGWDDTSAAELGQGLITVEFFAFDGEGSRRP